MEDWYSIKKSVLHEIDHIKRKIEMRINDMGMKKERDMGTLEPSSLRKKQIRKGHWTGIYRRQTRREKKHKRLKISVKLSII